MEGYKKTVKYLQAVIFIRMSSLLPLLNEIGQLRVIVETLKNLMGPMANLSIFMSAIFYEFALVGMFLFGGRIRTTTEAINRDPSIPMNYNLLNFNDTITSFMTLFALLVNNNW